MQCRWLALILTALAASSANAQTTPDVRVVARTEPAGSAWISQQVRLYLEVSTETFFRDAPIYPELQIEGAIVLSPSSFGANFTRTVNGKTYAGQRRTYVIFPERSGELSIPPLEVTLTVADGADGVLTLTRASLPLSLHTMMPRGAEEIDEFVSTARLDVRQQFDRPFDGLKTGDAVVRTITISAEDTLALVLPTISFSAVDGVALYPAQPRLSETTDRGRYSGTRVETATYVLERAGAYELPAIDVKWWNTATESMQTETLPAIRFDVAHQALPGALAPPLVDVSSRASGLAKFGRLVLDWLVEHAEIICVAAAIAYLGWLAWRRYAGPVTLRIAEARRRRRVSERALFSAFSSACRSGDDDLATAAFWNWFETAIDAKDDRHRAYFSIWGDIAAQRYGPGGHAALDTEALLAAASQWRSARRPGGGSPIPALNPSSVAGPL